MIQTRFLKKYFQIYKQVVGKFALNFRLTPGLSLSAFNQPAPFRRGLSLVEIVPVVFHCDSSMVVFISKVFHCDSLMVVFIPPKAC